jgi:hypothetical protein
MKIVDIAQEIMLLDSSNPIATSLPAVSYFLRANIGYLNTLLFEDFKIDQNTLEITHCNGNDLNPEAKAIIKQIYKIYDSKQQINNNMNALASDTLLSIKDEFGGVSYTRQNRNSMAQTWASIMRQETDILNEMVGSYKINKATPLAVFGDDFIPAQRGESLISLRNV